MPRTNSEENDVLGTHPVALKEYTTDYDGETPHFNKECENFMQCFVMDIFSESCDITQERKSRFGLLCQHNEARQWFSRLIDGKRVDFKEVDEIVFFRLVQYFAIVLFECHLSDDFSPATALLNMGFTYFHVSGFSEINHGSPSRSDPSKHFVYFYLKDQEIWKSLRFWTSSFLFAVDGERRKRPNRGSWRSLDKEEQKEVNYNEENSAFGHLGTFLYMMKSLDVAKEIREVFISKISTIENLSREQINELIASVEDAD